MTLVVARVAKGILSAVSDTGVTLNAETYGPGRGVPKLCILNLGLAVGFAGDVYTAIEALTNFDKNAHRHPASYFLDVHRAANEATDFLVLRDSPPSIIKVYGGKLAPPSQAAWIGNQKGFSIYQEKTNSGGRVHRGSVPEFEQLYTTAPNSMTSMTGEMIGAMRSIIANRQIPTIGGFCVVLNCRWLF
jgi:hypothetical protein